MRSPLIAALFNDHAAADRIRVSLSSGDTAFPTDRVHLTSTADLGHAGVVPASTLALKLEAYFRTLFDRDDEQECVRSLSEGVQNGRAAVVVFPRGDIEIKRARDVLRQGKPLQLYDHDLNKQTLEHAASEDSAPVVATVVGAVTGSNSSSR
jgi:hypothetical protein